ncbi:nitroreductase/quinone reductase family protein [Conexibacter sp. JD483]|uniref:nitroreductase/quinone reductase family protein n=1 Tax=unclassified Conexibacter TaxID=2627773 RepID=UPI002728B30D|nr:MULTISPECIES: nitroreductase/quinone reductase family protein [unclassified Conexibacter]MDO8185379.1 nitroreductase/quinone reductase family protein [Conexibacter sp. CPCC 205706]MDO8198445.1 nitroreductase/quinone reductase family protein [Conexibacter sp. CPCC 205762]MDR9368790.1 nitroreductase/quinone reductase family protein [Conexibacter sp. JD483]
MSSGPVWYSPKRWMYRGNRPRGLARAMNALSAWMYARGILTLGVGATLEIRGRRSGRTMALPVVVADYEGERYLVSMLGEEAAWVRNVRADGGKAVLTFGERSEVRLVEVPVSERAPIIKRYLALAPGARPHIPVDRRAPLADFERIAAQQPVFRIEPRS